MNPQIVITVNEQGQVQLQANINSPIMLYGILEAAKDAIRQNSDGKANGTGIVAAPATALKQLQAN